MNTLKCAKLISSRDAVDEGKSQRPARHTSRRGSRPVDHLLQQHANSRTYRGPLAQIIARLFVISREWRGIQKPNTPAVALAPPLSRGVTK